MSVSGGNSHFGVTTFKFVPSGGVPGQKRTQSQRACENCRKRKKRCFHHTEAAPRTSGSLGNSSTAAREHQDNSSDQGRQHSSAASYQKETNIQNRGSIDLQEDAGDQLEKRNPPTALAELRSRIEEHITPTQEGVETRSEQHSLPQTQESRNSRFIGDLNPEAIFLAATSPDASRGVSHDTVGVWLSSKLRNGTSQNEPASSQSPASLFYGSGSLVQKILVPLLEQECKSTIPRAERVEALSKIYFERVHPIFPIIDEEAFRSLTPSDPSHLLLQQGICLAASKNFAARQHLMLGDSSQRLSCREFGETLSGAMRISIEMGIVSNKIVLIQALTLMSQFSDNRVGEDLSSLFCGRAVHHVQSLGIHLIGQQEENMDRCVMTLLCCVWAVDRMNAAFNGRPVLMHERDFGKDLEQCFEQQEPCFRVFLQVVGLLDKVIDLYRPLLTSMEIPSLSWEFPAFEDVVTRCGSGSIGNSALATIETLYHSIAILSCRSKTWADPERSSKAYLRQSLSTSILSSTINREMHDQLTMFPFVPYATSLSMSIAYREMRHSKLRLHRARSRAQLQTLCDALSELGEMFWSASTTAEMGKKLLKEMDRVFSAVSSETRRPQQLGASNSSGATNSVECASNVPSQNAIGDVPMTGSEQILDLNFDPSVFDSIADVDLFGMFDPAFDLDGFDACLEGNLNPAFPNALQ